MRFPFLSYTYLRSDWLRGRQYSPYMCKERNMSILQCSSNKRKNIQNGWFTKSAWKSTETTCSRLSHSNTFDLMESEFREFACWLWGRNSLYWHPNIQIKFPMKFLTKFWTFWSEFHILDANESREIRNHKYKTSRTSMEHKWVKWGIICPRCIKVKIVALIVCLSLRENW